MNKPDISVIVVSTNEAAVLASCLRTLFQNTAHFEVLVFNNACTDETASLLETEFKRDELIVIHQSIKKGFIENCNEGILKARGRYILLLNPDTEVQKDTLLTMQKFMDSHPQVAVSTSRMKYLNKQIQWNCRRFPKLWTYFLRILHLDKVFPSLGAVQKYLMQDIDHQVTQPVDWFISAFFFMRKSVIEKIGILDPKLKQPFYCEDLEWCYRAKREGFQNYFVAETEILHHYRQSSRKGINFLTWVHLHNIGMFYLKHGWHMMFTGMTSRAKSP